MRVVETGTDEDFAYTIDGVGPVMAGFVGHLEEGSLMVWLTRDGDKPLPVSGKDFEGDPPRFRVVT